MTTVNVLCLEHNQYHILFHVWNIGCQKNGDSFICGPNVPFYTFMCLTANSGETSLLRNFCSKCSKKTFDPRILSRKKAGSCAGKENIYYAQVLHYV
jgi:hypothetical protein